MSAIEPGSTRFVRLEQLFHEALALPVANRAAFVAVATAGDPDLATALDEMLSYEQTNETGLSSSISDVASTLAVPADRSGERIGPYVLSARIRFGGMAEIYAAERADGQFAQQVAIKIVRADRPLAGMAALFQVERELLARLRHPHICQFFDGGSTSSGEPYFVMERLVGTTLTKACVEQHLPWRVVTRHVLDLCSAVAHIHGLLIVHRDIKPDNVLIADGPTGPVVKLLDFGIAGALKEDSQLSNTPGQSWYSQHYAAPEVVAGQAAGVAADVFSLGRVLQDLAPLFPADRRAEVVLIADKACAEQASERYLSVAALADDLARIRDRLPISIKPRQAWYVGWRFVQRHALALSVGTMMALLVGLALVREVTLRRSAQAATVLALDERDKAEAIRDFLLQAYEAASPETNQGRDLPVSELLDQQVEALQRPDSALAPSVRSDLLATLGATLMNLGRFERAEQSMAEAASVLDEMGEQGSLRWARLMLVRAQNAQRRDQFERAETWFKDVEQAQGWQGRGSDSLDVESTLYSSWAVVAQRASRQDEAEALIQRALNARRQRDLARGGPPETATYLVTLGAIQSARGNFDTALSTFESAYQENQRQHRDRTLEHLALLGWIGITLDRLAQPERAEPYLREAIVVAELLFKKPHPKLSSAYGNLGTMFLVNGRYAEAAPLLERGLEVMQELGDSSSAVYQTRINNLSRLALEREDLATAEPLLAELLSLRRKTFGDHSDRAALALLAKARLALLQSNPNRAADCLAEVRSILDKLPPSLAATLLPDLLLTDAETEAALGHQVAAQAKLAAFDQGPYLETSQNERDRSLWQFQRGRILVALSQPKAANTALQQALAGFGGPAAHCAHPICAQIQVRLAALAIQDDRQVEAATRLKLALPILEANMAPHSQSLKEARAFAKR
ncbi:hypothetical protein C7S18_15690 [Ahniella affigens]|uniref:Protein kinase domain-containing protein n=1 Tax=Ahniella affigens TaxID=2021234 RepID=A0A2P1PUM4_9GAMM|nr:serine/threonine-protein kinase [Ahniella affigens]AVP98539.1 hypothetical protein C7S18_15690 [Ahniella affigens]